ncbi:MAG: hypothetical protein ABIQ89_00845 [Candidatus Saccharimonadales bacterium]
MKQPLEINILSSDGYDRQSLPLIVSTFEDRGHQVNLMPVENSPEAAEILDGDVFIDRSAVIDVNFFRDMALGYFMRRADNKPTPVMVDNPFSTMISFDKRKTHRMFPDLIPETYDLDGVTNHDTISNFIGDEYVVIKDPFGWYGNGIVRLSPDQALADYGLAEGLVVQKYIPFSEGLGRIYTLNYEADFLVMASYMETPDIWRSGEGAKSTYRPVEVTKPLHEFARQVSKISGLYLNAIDYIDSGEDRLLLEINAVPNLYAPHNNVGANSFELFAEHVERSAASRRV